VIPHRKWRPVAVRLREPAIHTFDLFDLLKPKQGTDPGDPVELLFVATCNS